MENKEQKVQLLKVGRSPVQVLPKSDFSILLKLPVESTGE